MEVFLALSKREPFPVVLLNPKICVVPFSCLSAIRLKIYFAEMNFLDVDLGYLREH